MEYHANCYQLPATRGIGCAYTTGNGTNQVHGGHNPTDAAQRILRILQGEEPHSITLTSHVEGQDYEEGNRRLKPNDLKQISKKLQTERKDLTFTIKENTD